jgi:peptidoglycan/LPS O-acetylase OafA/YrhL
MRLRTFIAVVALLTACSLAWMILDDPSWTWPALLAAPIFNLGGGIAGFVFARRAPDRHQRLAGRSGAALSVVVLVFNVLVIWAFYGLRSALN